MEHRTPPGFHVGYTALVSLMKRQPTDEILTKIEDTQQKLRESIDQAGELASKPIALSNSIVRTLIQRIIRRERFL